MDTAKITAMRVGGKKLASIRQELIHFTKSGTSFEEIEAEAQRLIKAAGAKPSFSTVTGYHWATCITKNAGVCHGIPQGKVVSDGDIITIDVGLIWDGYHLDTSDTVAVGGVPAKTKEFLEVGRRSLAKAIAEAYPGNTVYEISRAMQKVVERHGFGCVYQLTGHEIGTQLHGRPVPCVAQKSDKRWVLQPGTTLAIEIMYTMGEPELVLDDDGWTYTTKDGSLSGMFEETVLVGTEWPEILTTVTA
ncbi:MAG: type I methionyl aminopeptidase [bacterium]|nr:type I methionyl aminopeptidase [bacterium]